MLKPPPPSSIEGYSFDQRWYLDTYEDVRVAVSKGLFPTAEDHYLVFGCSEGRLPCASAEDDQRMSRGPFARSDAPRMSDEARREQVAALWSEPFDAGAYWLSHPMVRARVNVLASGDPKRDTYDRLADIMISRGHRLPIARAVSIGCGQGGVERDLVRRGIVRDIDCYDLADGAIDEARRSTAEEGLQGLRFQVADFETAALPGNSVNLVLAHQSLHHIERLEQLFGVVAAALRPDGLLHLHEFVGPSRFQWTDAQVDEANAFIRRLPPRLRALASGRQRSLQGRATVAAMIASDPSEAVRSADILPTLRKYFDVVEERNLGGAILHLALAGVASNFDESSTDDVAMLEGLFRQEDEGMANGLLESDFKTIVAQRKESTAATAKRVAF